MEYHNGEVLAGNTDMNTKVEYKLDPVYALYFRIVPVSWNNNIALRFGANIIKL